MRSTIVLVMLLALFGCSADYTDLPEISVDFIWLKDQLCFDERSPEITLINVPDSTELLEVKMLDIDNRYNQGGGL